MIINTNNPLQCSIITNKCFYQMTADIMRSFEQKGYPNAADETAKVIAAYHMSVGKKMRTAYSRDYHEAFEKIDAAIRDMANKVFYTYDKKSHDFAYKSFQEFDYINAILGRQRLKKDTSPSA